MKTVLLSLLVAAGCLVILASLHMNIDTADGGQVVDALELDGGAR